VAKKRLIPAILLVALLCHAQVTSKGYKILPDGSVAVGQTQPGATITSAGYAINPDGSLAISASKLPGSFVNSGQLTINPDGSVFTTGGGGGGGGGATPSGSLYDIQTYASATTLSSISTAAARTGQVLGANNAGPATFQDPGIVNNQTSTAPAVSCDTATTVGNRGQSFGFTSASAVNFTLPDANTAACANAYFLFDNEGAGTVTIYACAPSAAPAATCTNGGTNTINYLSGGSGAGSAASVALAQYNFAACQNQDNSATWKCRITAASGGAGSVVSPFGPVTSGVYSVHVGSADFTGATTTSTHIPGLAFTIPNMTGNFRVHCSGIYSASATATVQIYDNLGVAVAQHSASGVWGVPPNVGSGVSNNTVAAGAHSIFNASTSGSNNAFAFDVFFNLTTLPGSTWTFQIDASTSTGTLTISRNSTCDIWQSN